MKSNRVRLREQGNGSGSLQSEWKEASCGAPVEQIEPGKTNKKHATHELDAHNEL